VDRREKNKDVIEEFRANRGVCTGFLEGSPVILLTTTGAKTGRELCSPLVYSTDGEHVVVIASNGGGPKHPSWSHNIVANPMVTVEVGTDKWDGTAHLVEGGERRRLYDAQAELLDYFIEYEENAAATGRVIPVFRIARN
jgi:deazaflavin-dependent oxidoreductase (nitroreductase family)